MKKLNPETIARINTMGGDVTGEIVKAAAANTKRKEAKEKLPLYDRGGNVNVNDGKHQVAILENGERVLNPRETAEYDRIHGAKGPTKMKAQMPRIAPLYDEGGEVSADDNKGGYQRISLPAPAEPVTSDSTETAVQPREMSPEEKTVDTDKKTGMGAGPNGLVKLGTALIHEKLIKDSNQRDPEEGLVAPKEFNRGTPAPGMPKIKSAAASVVDPQTLALVPGTPENRSSKPVDMMQRKAGGELIPANPEDRDFAKMQAKADYKAKLANYDTRIQAELDKATPEGQENADRLTAAKQNLIKSTPWGSAANHPGVLGKIGHIAEMVAQRTPGLAPIVSVIPGSEVDRGVDRAATRERLHDDTQLATQRSAEEDKSSKVAKSPWEPVTGEQFTHYNSAGAPVQQLYRNTATGEQTWRAVPNAEGVAPAPTSGTPTVSPTGEGYYGDRQQPKFAEKPVGQEGTKQYAEQLKATTLRVPKGYDVAQPEILSTDTNATAAEKIKEYNTSVNNAILADRSDKAQAARETAKESAERRAEERAERKVVGYAQDADGHTILTDKFNASLNNQPFEQATPGDLAKDRQATRMLNDVQLNVSRYTAAANKYDAANLSAEQKAKDADNMAFFLNHAGYFDMEASISQGGHITIPVVTAASEKASTLQRSEQYKNLSPEAKQLLDGYIRTMGAVPAYQKALTGIGRSNKEMLDLELANIANPTMGTTEILRKQAQFQENVDRASEGFPKLPGLKRTSDVKQETEKTSDSAQSLSVEAPNGTVYNFKTKSEADAFRKKAGL